jgi:hypothetical protein
MSSFTFDVRDIPVLNDAIDVAATIPSVPAAPAEAAPAEPAEAAATPEPIEPIEPVEPEPARIDISALQSAIIEDTLALADSLTKQAAKEIENLLYERVFDQLRAQLPELVERRVRAHLPGGSDDADEPGEPDG